MATIPELAQWILNRDDIAIIPHVNPDGDALGSALALKMVLEKLGKRACVCCQDGVPHMYSFLPGRDDVLPADKLPFLPKALLFEDVAAFDRAGDRGALSSQVKDWAVIDHHETNPGFAPVSVVDGAASATGVVVLRLMDHLDVKIEGDLALYLYVSISTDTGNFSFSNTTPETLRDMARLLEAGLDLDRYSRLTFRMRSVPRVRLLGKAIEATQLYAGGRLAVTQITQEMFDQCGALAPDTEGIVNTLSDMEGVEVAMTVEARDGGTTTKFSLRSVGQMDVARIASNFGGGGHRNAAGMNLCCPVEEAAPQALRAVLAAMEA